MYFSKTFILRCSRLSHSFIAGVVDSDDKLITVFIFTSDKLLPVSLLPYRQLIITGVVVTGEKLKRIIEVMESPVPITPGPGGN